MSQRVKNSPAVQETRDTGSIPGSERSPEEGNGYPLHVSCLENSVNRGAWRATDHGDHINYTDVICYCCYKK